jgi:methyl-accepting chemotaxis protein
MGQEDRDRGLVMGAGRWVRDRKVSGKILAVAGVAIAGTLVTGTMALVGIAGLQSTRNSELPRGVPYITSLNEAALQAKAAANDERGYLIAGEVKFRDEALSRQDDVNESLASARALGSAAEQATVDKIKAATDTWFTALETEFTTYRTY